MWQVEMLNPSMEGEFASIFQVEGVHIYTRTTNNIEGLHRHTNHDVRTF
jgi:hypothetical protein